MNRHSRRINGLRHLGRIVRYLLPLARQSNDGAIHLLVRPLVSDLEVGRALGGVLEQMRLLVLLPIGLLEVELADLVLAPEVLRLLGPRLQLRNSG